MTIVCRLSTLIRIVVAAAFLGILLGCAGGAVVLHQGTAARPVPAHQTARDTRVQLDEPGKEVGTWRRTRS